MQFTPTTIAERAIASICAAYHLDDWRSALYVSDRQPHSRVVVVVVCLGSMLQQRLLISTDGYVQRYPQLLSNPLFRSPLQP